MGLLNLFKKSVSEGPGLTRLPSGSYTIDATGKVLVSTLPRAFPEARLKEISHQVLQAFRLAREANMAVSEVVVHYASLRLTARELRGGAIIFLAPKGVGNR
ncbi:MAG: hypothetical protein RI897_3400 [Verrucomicrobiota bacterium]|jgi:hypothetical protein